MAAKQLKPEDYTIGWICALPVEAAAAKKMLDVRHLPVTKDQHDNDCNVYTLGSIGPHNVAIANPPAGQLGTTAAAVTAMRLLSSFKSIRFGLMVGIAGGVPTKKDVRLGDVVISQPDGQFGGVVQYDMGKTGKDGKISRTGLLNTPPPVLLNNLARFRTDYILKELNVVQHLVAFERLPDFAYQGAASDVLYNASYDHTPKEADTCAGCDKKEKKQRPDRIGTDPVIHFGTIACGNQVMKDGLTRDKINSDLGGGVLCFEMESAGLMNNYPCLVFRSICDYSDSHKNKKWQEYAAAVAAACAKEFLVMVEALPVQQTETAIERLEKGSKPNEPQYTSSDHNEVRGNITQGGVAIQGGRHEYEGSTSIGGYKAT